MERAPEMNQSCPVVPILCLTVAYILALASFAMPAPARDLTIYASGGASIDVKLPGGWKLTVRLAPK